MTDTDKPYLDPCNWKAPNRGLYLDQFRDSSIPRRMCLIHDRISPHDLYCYLKARFGPAQGPMMALRENSSDNLIHWDYLLGVDGSDTHIEFIGLNSKTEVVFWNVASVSDDDLQRLAGQIKADLKLHARSVGATRKALEHWLTFTNPYARIGHMVVAHENSIRRLNSAMTLPKLDFLVADDDARKQFTHDLPKFIKRVGRLAALCQTTRTLVPILAESFINLLIFVLAKAEIKRDKRLYGAFITRDIDVRVRSLHLYCDGFRRAIDANANEFKQFHSLMNRRNDLLHGNVDPQKLTTDEFYFDGRIPVCKTNRSLAERSYTAQLNGIRPEEVLADLDDVRRFIVFVIEHLESDHAEALLRIMEDPEPGWRPDTGRVGILFSMQLDWF